MVLWGSAWGRSHVPRTAGSAWRRVKHPEGYEVSSSGTMSLCLCLTHTPHRLTPMGTHREGWGLGEGQSQGDGIDAGGRPGAVTNLPSKHLPGRLRQGDCCES